MPLEYKTSVSYSRNWRGGSGPNFPSKGTTTKVDSAQQLTFSHFRHGKPGYPGDIGGPWELRKRRYLVSPAYRYFKGVSSSFDGFCHCERVTGQSLASIPLFDSNNDLDSYGTTAMARSLPTNPASDFFVFAGELREGLPHVIGTSLFKSKVKDLRKVPGDEYLNVQFGWMPMVSDLRKFGHAIKNHNKILNAYRKGSDTKIKRRYVTPTTTSWTSFTGNGTFTPSQAQLTGKATQSSFITTDRWFEGAFRYHIPVGSSYLDKALEYEAYANKLFGIRLTPEAVWNLTPWSWFADWFGNTGDIMHNISALGRDGLAMQYGYCMCQKKVHNTVLASATDSQGRTYNSSYQEFLETKQRRQATPYGFGLTFDQLTTRQLAVMAALGITRS